MPRPLCTDCEIEYNTDEIGVYVIEHTKEKVPIAIWSADLKKCPMCGNTLIAGYGNHPISRPHQDNWEEVLENVKDKAYKMF